MRFEELLIRSRQRPGALQPAVTCCRPHPTFVSSLNKLSVIERVASTPFNTSPMCLNRPQVPVSAMLGCHREALPCIWSQIHFNASCLMQPSTTMWCKCPPPSVRVRCDYHKYGEKAGRRNSAPSPLRVRHPESLSSEKCSACTPSSLVFSPSALVSRVQPPGVRSATRLSGQ